MSAQEPTTVIDWVTHVIHAVAGGTIVATLLGLLPSLAAALAILWYLIQIAESKSVRSWLMRRRERKLLALQHKMRSLELRQEIDATWWRQVSQAQHHQKPYDKSGPGA